MHKAAFYVRVECIKLCLGVDEEVSRQVTIKGQANMDDTVVGVYFRPPDQEEKVNKASYTQLKVASWSQLLVIMVDFNHSDICWEDHTPTHKQFSFRSLVITF